MKDRIYPLFLKVCERIAYEDGPDLSEANQDGPDLSEWSIIAKPKDWAKKVFDVTVVTLNNREKRDYLGLKRRARSPGESIRMT